MLNPSFYSIPKEWDGATAFIIAGGPSVTQEMIDKLRGRKVLAINSSWESAPWADYLFFGDMRWYLQNKKIETEFPGKILSVDQIPQPSRALRLRRVTTPGLCASPDSVMINRTSLTAAINILVHLGVKKIPMIGADGKTSSDGRTHHHQPHKWPQRSNCWDQQRSDLEGIVASVKAAGVEAFNCNPDSAFRMFPFIDFEAALAL